MSPVFSSLRSIRDPRSPGSTGRTTRRCVAFAVALAIPSTLCTAGHAQHFSFPDGAEGDVEDPCRQSSYPGGPGAFGLLGSEIACGKSSAATGDASSAYGIGSNAAGTSSVAVGNTATAGGDHSIAIGGSIGVHGEVEPRQTVAAGRETIAIGAGAQANNGWSIAIGTLSTARQGGVALGDSTFAGTGAIAIGQGVRAERQNQVVIGTSASSYRLSGMAFEENRGYQQGTTYFVTSDSQGNLATTELDIDAVADLPDEVSSLRIDVDGHENRISANTSLLDAHDDLLGQHTGQISALDGRVNTLESGLADLGEEIGATRSEARQGIAAAIAMASAPMPSAPGKTTWASNLGFFKGETAFGGSLSHRFDTAVPFGITAGYSYGGGDSHAARLGLMGEF